MILYAVILWEVTQLPSSGTMEEIASRGVVSKATSTTAITLIDQDFFFRSRSRSSGNLANTHFQALDMGCMFHLTSNSDWLISRYLRLLRLAKLINSNCCGNNMTTKFTSLHIHLKRSQEQLTKLKGIHNAPTCSLFSQTEFLQQRQVILKDA